MDKTTTELILENEKLYKAIQVLYKDRHTLRMALMALQGSSECFCIKNGFIHTNVCKQAVKAIEDTKT